MNSACSPHHYFVSPETPPSPEDNQIAVQFMKILVESCNLNKKDLIREDILGYTPLHMAVKTANIKLAELLLQRGHDIDSIIVRPTIMFMLPNEQASKKMMTQLNRFENSHDTPLILACSDRNEDLIALLLKFNPDLSFRQADGFNALGVYVVYSKSKTPLRKETVQALCAASSKALNGLQGQHPGATLLYLAAQKANLEAIETLLSLGADPNQRSAHYHISGLMIACLKSSLWGNEITEKIILLFLKQPELKLKTEEFSFALSKSLIIDSKLALQWIQKLMCQPFSGHYF